MRPQDKGHPETGHSLRIAMKIYRTSLKRLDDKKNRTFTQDGEMYQCDSKGQWTDTKGKETQIVYVPDGARYMDEHGRTYTQGYDGLLYSDKEPDGAGYVFFLSKSLLRVLDKILYLQAAGHGIQ